MILCSLKAHQAGNKQEVKNTEAACNQFFKDYFHKREKHNQPLALLQVPEIPSLQVKETAMQIL